MAYIPPKQFLNQFSNQRGPGTIQTGATKPAPVAPVRPAPKQNTQQYQTLPQYFDKRYGPGGKPPPLTEDFLYALGSTGPGWQAEAQRAQALSGQRFSRPLEQYGAGYSPPPAPAPYSGQPPGVQALQQQYSLATGQPSATQGVDPQRLQADPAYRSQVLQMQQMQQQQSRLPYMQTLFDRLRAEQQALQLQPRVNPVSRF